MTDVFISYSRRDGEFVRDLYGFLSEAGRDVWVDWEDIPPASQWEQDIYDSIDAADSLIFVVSASSLASEYCLAELGHAQGRGKRIVPLAGDGADPDAAPEGLRQLNWIWLRGTDDRDEAFAKLTSALDTDLEWSRAHTRLLVRAVEWEARDDSSLLLRGRDLKAVEQVLTANAGKEPVPTELQQRYVHASRRGAARRQRAVLGSVLVALAVSVALGVVALLQRNTARSATDKATSVALASTATNRRAGNLDQALLLSLAAYRLSATAEARSSLVSALEAARRLELEAMLHSDTTTRSVALGPDGRTVAAVGEDGVVRLWDVRARQPLGELPGTSPVVGLSFTPKGNALAVASKNGVVRFWDASTRRPIGRALRTGRLIDAAVFSADGRKLAASGPGGMWFGDVRSRNLRRLADPYANITSLALSPNGRTLAAAAANINYGGPKGGGPAATVRLWDTATGRPGDLPVSGSVETLAFSPDSRKLATGGYVDGYDFIRAHGEIQLWDARKLKLLREDDRSGSSVGSLVFAPAPGGRTIAAGRHDGSIQLLTVSDLKPSGTLLHGLGAGSISFSRDGHSIAGAAPGGVRVWDIRDRGSFGRPLLEADIDLSGVSFSPDGRTVAVGDSAADDDGIVRLVDVASGKQRTPYRMGDTFSSVASVAYSPDGKTLAAVNDNDYVRLWSTSDRKPVGTLPPRDGLSGSRLAFDPSGDVLAAAGEGGEYAAAGEGGEIRLWDVRKKRSITPTLHTGDVLALAFVDHNRLATVGADGTVQVWEVGHSKPRGPAQKPVPLAGQAAFSPDGRSVAFGDGGGDVWLWDRLGNAPATQLPGGVGSPVSELAFSSDGRTLAIATEALEVRLADVRTWTPLGPPLRAAETEVAIRHVAFSPDSRVVAAAGDTLRLWKGVLWHDETDLQAQVCGLVIGDLTKAEWAAIAPALPYRRTCSG